MWRVAFIVMTCAIIAQHLGLSKAIATVFSQIADCPKCLTFWSCMGVLLYVGVDIVTTIALSVFMSYLSYYIGLIFFYLRHLYNRLWQKIDRLKAK